MSLSKLEHCRLFADVALEVYLLPMTPWEDALALQHRLAYEVGDQPRRRAALLLCEHPPIITIGREGSRGHVLFDDDELRSRRWEVRWTNRGAGAWLHMPGQLVAYPILPVDPERLSLDRYRAGLYQAMLDVLEEFGVVADRDVAQTGVCVDHREIGSVGIAVTNWVAYHGCYLNVHVPLDDFDGVRTNPRSARKATSLLRERRLPTRTSSVRESFSRHFADVFGFASSFLCRPPPFRAKRPAHVATGNR